MTGKSCDQMGRVEGQQEWSMEICPERQKVNFWAKSISAQYTGRYFPQGRQISFNTVHI